MNSNIGKNFEFDFGLGSSRSKPLNQQKNPTPPYSSSGSSFSSTAQPKSAWQPNKPAWTHQPAPDQANQPGLSGPNSMVGDIFGKSWGTTGRSGSTAGIGVAEKNPNLFGDLVGSALGQGKSNSNAPLKNATPSPTMGSNSSNKSSFSMGNLTNSLPKTDSNYTKVSGNQASSETFGSFFSGHNIGNSNVININKGPQLGGPSLRGMVGGSGMSSNKDPFVSLVDFGSKKSGNLRSTSNKAQTGDDAFGNFQNAPKSTASTFPNPSSGYNGSNTTFTGSNLSSNMGDFGMATMDVASKNEVPVQSTSADPLDVLFSSTSASAGVAANTSLESLEADDWGFDSEFRGGSQDVGGTTTELEGLPPPPAGVTASMAKDKGMDNYKQGQYADAIKWLSWAVILLEKVGYSASTSEVLSSRASCYKEVGEYKKAVADCTKVLEHDDANVSVLVQRALLYESMEKYKLGAEDLRAVLKFDPSNRIARSTVHRLAKLAD